MGEIPFEASPAALAERTTPRGVIHEGSEPRGGRRVLGDRQETGLSVDDRLRDAAHIARDHGESRPHGLEDAEGKSLALRGQDEDVRAASRAAMSRCSPWSVTRSSRPRSLISASTPGRRGPSPTRSRCQADARTGASALRRVKGSFGPAQPRDHDQPRSCPMGRPQSRINVGNRVVDDAHLLWSQDPVLDGDP